MGDNTCSRSCLLLTSGYKVDSVKIFEVKDKQIKGTFFLEDFSA